MWLLNVFQVSLLLSLESLCVPDKGNGLDEPVLDPFMPESRRLAMTDVEASRASSERGFRSGRYVHGDA